MPFHRLCFHLIHLPTLTGKVDDDKLWIVWHFTSLWSHQWPPDVFFMILWNPMCRVFEKRILLFSAINHKICVRYAEIWHGCISQHMTKHIAYSISKSFARVLSETAVVALERRRSATPSSGSPQATALLSWLKVLISLRACSRKKWHSSALLSYWFLST